MKTEQKHTPGSWQIANGAQLRVIPGHRRANAALIAAAPDGLALLQQIADMIQNRPDDLYDIEGEPTEELNTWNMAYRQYIAKARGLNR